LVNDDAFDWDAGNEDHILNHGVEPGEVEEALLDPARIRADARNAPGERRYALIGATEEARVLFVRSRPGTRATFRRSGTHE
jgi:uncharacterized DUF497 family protein